MYINEHTFQFAKLNDRAVILIFWAMNHPPGYHEVDGSAR